MKIHTPVKRTATINMVPLIDSMFLILVFFIYAMMSMAIQKGLPVTLPNASAALMPPKEFVTISINKNGHYAINDSSVSESALDQQIRKLARGSSKPNILIRADEQATHGKVVTVLNSLQEHNITNISFQTNGEAAN